MRGRSLTYWLNRPTPTRGETMPDKINPVDFARFLSIPVEEAKAMLAQERQELAATGDPDIHGGYNYRTQEWVTR